MLFLFSLLCFEEVADDVFHNPKVGDHESQHFDSAIFALVKPLRSPGLTEIMRDVTALGSWSVIFAFFLLLAVSLIFLRDFPGLLYLSTSMGGAALLPGILKDIFQRERPAALEHLVYVSNPSFPSGHSLGAAAVYFSLAFYWSKHLRNWRRESLLFFFTGVVIFAVGASRVYLGVHFPTDVVAGFAAGFAWASLVSLPYYALTMRKQ